MTSSTRRRSPHPVRCDRWRLFNLWDFSAGIPERRQPNSLPLQLMKPHTLASGDLGYKYWGVGAPGVESAWAVVTFVTFLDATSISARYTPTSPSPRRGVQIRGGRRIGTVIYSTNGTTGAVTSKLPLRHRSARVIRQRRPRREECWEGGGGQGCCGCRATGGTRR